MQTRARCSLCSLALALAAGVALGQEAVPAGAERLISPADVRGIHGEVSGLIISNGPLAESGAVPESSGLSGARIGVADLSAPGRVPVLYFAFDAATPLEEQIQKAVKGIERCGSREELVLTVRRCVSGAGARRHGDSLARRRAESVARTLRRRGFRTEVAWGRLNTYCVALPAKYQKRIHPLEVTVERVRSLR